MISKKSDPMDLIQDRIVYTLHLIVSNGLHPMDRMQDCIVYQGLMGISVIIWVFSREVFQRNLPLEKGFKNLDVSS